MKSFASALAVFVAAPVAAQVPKVTAAPIAAPAQPDAIPLWPSGSLPQAAVPESWSRVTVEFADGTRFTNRSVRNVSIPTIEPTLPARATATGAAVVVAPGGAFKFLSIDSEGYDVARWLADHGVAAFVLKYRLNQTPREEAAAQAAIGEQMSELMRQGGAVAPIDEPRAYQDALRALKLVRDGAARWHIDPARVGMIGFSAGAMTTLQSVLIGRQSDRPSFFGYIYGPMVSVPVPAGAPPMFAAFALDDPLFGRQGFGIVDAWHRAGVPVELHAYQKGDHGFATGRAGTTTTLVMDEFRLWMETNGWLAAPRAR